MNKLLNLVTVGNTRHTTHDTKDIVVNSVDVELKHCYLC